VLETFRTYFIFNNILENRMPILGALAILVSSDVLKIQKKSTGTLF